MAKTKKKRKSRSRTAKAYALIDRVKRKRAADAFRDRTYSKGRYERSAEFRAASSLGCGPGPVSSGPCAFDRPLAGFRGFGSSGPIRVSLGSSRRGSLRGLRGTPAEHERTAEGLIGRAEAIRRRGANAVDSPCEAASRWLVIADFASKAEAEASWVPGARGSALHAEAVKLSDLAWRNIKTRSGCKVR